MPCRMHSTDRERILSEKWGIGRERNKEKQREIEIYIEKHTDTKRSCNYRWELSQSEARRQCTWLPFRSVSVIRPLERTNSSASVSLCHSLSLSISVFSFISLCVSLWPPLPSPSLLYQGIKLVQQGKRRGLGGGEQHDGGGRVHGGLANHSLVIIWYYCRSNAIVDCT